MRTFLIVFAVIARFFPHPWNFTPVGGFSLFAGSVMPARTAWLVPILSLFLFDLVTDSFYGLTEMAGVYAGYLAAMFVGHFVIRGRETALRIGGGAVGASLAFFILSNLGVWAGGYYGYSFAGLVTTYVAALPFLAPEMAGTLLYAGALFAAKRWFETRYGAIRGFAAA